KFITSNPIPSRISRSNTLAIILYPKPHITHRSAHSSYINHKTVIQFYSHRLVQDLIPF
ncbi:hypothetical protein LINPERPRIM_LOCUS21045, partial [Linum perenne]